MEKILRINIFQIYRDQTALKKILSRMTSQLLIIQNKEPGISRVIVYGINTKELASGTLFQFTLQGKRQSGDLLYIRDKFPLFAPAQANEGVVLGQPYALQVK